MTGMSMKDNIRSKRSILLSTRTNLWLSLNYSCQSVLYVELVVYNVILGFKLPT